MHLLVYARMVDLPRLTVGIREFWYPFTKIRGIITLKVFNFRPVALRTRHFVIVDVLWETVRTSVCVCVREREIVCICVYVLYACMGYYIVYNSSVPTLWRYCYLHLLGDLIFDLFVF